MNTDKFLLMKGDKIIEIFSENYMTKPKRPYSIAPIKTIITAPDDDIALQIEQLINHLQIRYEGVEKIDDNTIIVRNVFGDWKHEHMYLKLCLTEVFEITYSHQIVIGDDSSDTFTADHYYRLKE